MNYLYKLLLICLYSFPYMVFCNNRIPINCLSEKDSIKLRNINQLILKSFNTPGIFYKHCDSMLEIADTSCTPKYIMMGHYYKGIRKFNDGRYKEAIEYCKKFVHLGNKFHLQKQKGLLLKLMGNSYVRESNYIEAIGAFKKAISAFKVSGEGDWRTGELHSYIADVYYKLQEFQLAIDYANNSITFLDSTRRNILGRAYRVLGSSYMFLEEFKESEKNLIKAEEHATDNDDFSNVYNRLGNLFLKKADFNKAIYYFSKAKNHGEKSFDEIRKIDPLINLGATYCQKREYAKSKNSLHNALILLDSTDHNLNKIECFFHLSKCYLGQSQLDSALIVIQKGMALATIENVETPLLENPLSSDILMPYAAISLLENKTIALNEKYKKNGNRTHLFSSFKSLQLAVELMDEYSEFLFSEKSQLLFNENGFSVFEKGIEISMELFRITGQEDFRKQAFIYSEKAKAKTLFSISQRIKKYTGIPHLDSLLIEERALMRRIFSLKKRAKQDSFSNAVQEILRTKEQISTIQAILKKEAPYLSNSQIPFVNISGTNNLLKRENAVIIDYFWGENTFYAFLLDEDSIMVHSFELKDEITESLSVLRNCVKSSKSDYSTEDFTISALRLYNHLLKPFENNFKDKRLIIVPDNQLFDLPFEILVTEDISPKVYTRLPFLVKRNPISYIPSASLLIDYYNTEKQVSKSNFIGFFPRNEKGAKRLSSVLENNFGATIYFGESATETNLKTNISDFQVITIFAHTERDVINPYIQLSKHEDSENDGFLYLNEITELKLNSSLVTLGACETGIGEYIKGEGVISFSREFLKSGCPSIITGQWQIPPKQSAEILQYFYENLKNGMSKDVALQKAKLTFLEKKDSEKNVKPYYWAGTILTGNALPLIDEKKISPWLYIGLLIMGLTLFLLFFRRERN